MDDEPQALRYIRDTLVRSGYQPVVTGKPEEALRLMAEEKPELDLMLPGTDGIQLMQDILEMVDVPVIFLSAYGREEQVARAFDLGAADYVVKPFSPTELAARIRAALRRRTIPETQQPYVLGDLAVDYGGRRATLAGRPLHLTPTEYRLLAELSANAGRVLTYERLQIRVWGAGEGGRRVGHAHHREQAAAQAGGERRQPRLHLHRAPGGLLDAQGGDAGLGMTPVGLALGLPSVRSGRII